MERVSGSVLLAMSDESTRLVGPTSELFPFCDLVVHQLGKIDVPTSRSLRTRLRLYGLVVGSQEMESYGGNSRSVSYEVVVSDNFLQFL